MKNNFKIKLSIISEFLGFLKANKKYWLIPIVFCLFIIGALLVVAEGSVIAPFIYALF